MRGRCRGVDSSVFFHPDPRPGRARAQREMRAKEICRRCPVLAECRSHALRVCEPYGIWGGMSEAEREVHARRSCSPRRGLTASVGARPSRVPRRQVYR